ncbi:MAG: hypothetical protein K2O16_13425 [Lachnospiraceae bacterium]|nr:hypothetical protein [Lachnospiraceae bacterium]
MISVYDILDNIIQYELGKNQAVAVYPLNEAGMLAKDILSDKYGKKAIIIDNYLAQHTDDIMVMDIDQFEQLYCADITIIICELDMELNREIVEDLRKRELVSKTRNILDIRGYMIESPEKEEYFEQIKRLCKVQKAVEYGLIRIGSESDGGYVMLNDFGDDNTAYSFGIGNNIDWDENIADYGIDVYCYDHTINQLPKENTRLFFQKTGICGEDDIENNLLSMETILNKNNHQKKNRLILKMDVEGAEWEFINTISIDTLKQFSQMTFELHGITNIANREMIMRALEKLNKTHYIIWVHGNNGGGSETAGTVVMPRLLEITYVNKEQYPCVEAPYDCPLDIDRPNMDEYPDIELKNW